MESDREERDKRKLDTVRACATSLSAYNAFYNTRHPPCEYLFIAACYVVVYNMYFQPAQTEIRGPSLLDIFNQGAQEEFVPTTQPQLERILQTMHATYERVLISDVN